jgi:hypothetical protein
MPSGSSKQDAKRIFIHASRQSDTQAEPRHRTRQPLSIWGIIFNKITNELIIQGNGGFLSKTRISIKTSDQDSSTTGRLEADGHAPSIMPEAQCSVVNSFNAAIEHLAALRIKDGKHGRSKKSNFI